MVIWWIQGVMRVCYSMSLSDREKSSIIGSLILQNDIQSVNDTGNVSKNGKENVDE